MPRTSRRSFLAGSAAIAAGGSIAAALEGCYRPGSPLHDSESARRIGARHAARDPDAERALWRGTPPATPAEWGPRIARLRREDFEADRLVRVDGWWLAETEIRLCVLLHTTG